MNFIDLEAEDAEQLHAEIDRSAMAAMQLGDWRFEPGEGMRSYLWRCTTPTGGLAITAKFGGYGETIYPAVYGWHEPYSDGATFQREHREVTVSEPLRANIIAEMHRVVDALEKRVDEEARK